MKVKLVVVFTMLAVMTVVSGGQAADLSKVDFQLNWKISGAHAAYFVAVSFFPCVRSDPSNLCEHSRPWNLTLHCRRL